MQTSPTCCIAWAGLADHLDVIGHYRAPAPTSGPAHVDWLTSGSAFDQTHFEVLMDAVATGMLRSSAPSRRQASRHRCGGAPLPVQCD